MTFNAGEPQASEAYNLALAATNADNLTSGTVADARIASTIARDTEVTTAIATQHTADQTEFANASSTTTALAGKVSTTRTVNGHALSADVTVTASDVGLGNVDNTSDTNKPVSTAQAAADALSGSGDPEGVTTATVGRIYRDTTNGWIYEKQTGTGNTGWVSVGTPVPRLVFPSGTYVPPHPGTGTLAGTNDSLRLVPWFCPQTLSVTRIAGEITTIGESGSKLRLGIYADDGTGHPGSLVLDAGQIAGNSATVQEITLGSTLTLSRGWYWLGGAVQSAPTTAPIYRVNAVERPAPGFLASAGTSLPAANTATGGYQQASVSGSLPGSFTGTTTASTAARLIFKLA